jgi:ubiquinone biosynthesis protein UbiJ
MTLTYPCVVRGRIVELTAEQIAQVEQRLMTPEEKITTLANRVSALERLVARLLEKLK